MSCGDMFAKVLLNLTDICNTLAWFLLTSDINTNHNGPES